MVNLILTVSWRIHPISFAISSLQLAENLRTFDNFNQLFGLKSVAILRALKWFRCCNLAFFPKSMQCKLHFECLERVNQPWLDLDNFSHPHRRRLILPLYFWHQIICLGKQVLYNILKETFNHDQNWKVELSTLLTGERRRWKTALKKDCRRVEKKTI